MDYGFTKDSGDFYATTMLNLVERQKPYIAINKMLEVFKGNGDEEYINLAERIKEQIDNEEDKNSSLVYIKILYNLNHAFNRREDCKIIELSEDIKQLFIDTETEDFTYYPLPSPYLFINETFDFGDKKIYGVLLVDNRQLTERMYDEMPKEDISAFFIGSVDGQMTHYAYPKINEFLKRTKSMENISSIIKDMGMKNEKLFLENKNNLEIIKKVCLLSNVMSNILSSEHQDIIYVEQNNKERNKKRQKRGKPALPSNVRYIKLGGQSLVYASAYRKERQKQRFKSRVKGFPRTYKHHRYTKMRGVTTWILPFIRGVELPDRPELQLFRVSKSKDFDTKKLIRGENNAD